MGTLAKRRRQKLQKILDSDDKMGLSRRGRQQLSEYFAKKAPASGRPSMADLEPSAAKVLHQILEGEYEDLPEWLGSRKLLREGPQAKKAEGGEEERWEGADVSNEAEGVEGADEWLEEEGDEMEDYDDEEDHMAPEPVSP